MPYIKNDKRWKFYDLIDELVEEIENVGDLDYCITQICEKFMLNNGGVKFENMAKIAGTVLFVILENYRRITSPYEDFKKTSNGDVYKEIDYEKGNKKEKVK